MARNLKEDVGMFTLVELLVVITVISVLAGMLMPALQRARESARNAVCINNEKQLSLSFMFYTRDNNGFFPPWGQGSGADPSEPYWWSNTGGMLGHYTPRRSKSDGFAQGIWTCPSNDLPYSENVLSYEDGDGVITYDINITHICRPSSGGLTRLQQIDRPSGVCLMGEAVCGGGVTGDGCMHCPECVDWDAEPFKGRPYAVHEDGCNILFVDGHVTGWNIQQLKNNEDNVWGHNGL